MKSRKSYFLSLILFFSIFFSLLHADEVAFSYVPKKVYEKQIFPISFIVTSSSQNPSINFYFEGESPILKKPEIIHNETKTFYTFYFKTTDKLFIIPRISIILNGEEKILNSVKISVKKLPKAKNFSGVIASDLKVKNHQVSIFDDNTNLIAISLEAHDANLEDIYIPSALKDGVENAKRIGSKMEIDYYIVIPARQNRLNFTYFDTTKDTFVKKILDIKVHDGTVAAQTDLNPKDDSFEAIKKYTLIILAVLFLILFLWKQDFFYLILSVISAGILLTFYASISTICIKEGSPLYIVPTSTSTTISHIDKKITTTKLADSDGFVKIKNSNGVTGWIRNEDICDN